MYDEMPDTGPTDADYINWAEHNAHADDAADVDQDDDDEPEPDMATGVTIHVQETAANPVTILVREGCSGSPNCALELYVCPGLTLTYDGPNLHLSEDEAHQLRRALDAAHVQRQRARYEATL